MSVFATPAKPPPRRPRIVPGKRQVPKDLLGGHELWPPRFRRLVVTGFVLMVDSQWWDRAWHQEATRLWGERLNRAGRVSVMSALIELEQLGACRNIQDQGDCYSLEVG